VPYATFNATNHVGSFYYQDMFTYHAMSNPGDVLFINENAARFIYETYAEENYMIQCVPNLTQKKIFSVFDRATIERWADDDSLYPIEGYTPMDLAAIDASDDPALAVADTLEDLAAKAGLDAEKLKVTIDRYNENCDLGIDRDFGKDSTHLFPVKTAPFYAAHITAAPGVMIGGVETDINSQVVDMKKEPIPGLYAVGVDGCMLYRNIYTFDTACAGANANNINSARVAANHITATI
jgi:fumarate reductase flavoprotein subunit